MFIIYGYNLRKITCRPRLINRKGLNSHHQLESEGRKHPDSKGLDHTSDLYQIHNPRKRLHLITLQSKLCMYLYNTTCTVQYGEWKRVVSSFRLLSLPPVVLCKNPRPIWAWASLSLPLRAGANGELALRKRNRRERGKSMGMWNIDRGMERQDTK